MTSRPDPKIQTFTLPPQHEPPAKCTNSTRHNPACSGPVYQCTQCTIRMCEPCILSELDKPRTPHEATHEVQELYPNIYYNFTRFAQKRLSFISPPKTSLTRAFLSSEHAFTPSSRQEKMMILSLDLPPGSYNLSIRVYTQSHQDKLVNLQLLDRLFRNEDTHCNGVNLGRISISTLTDTEKKPSWSRSVGINVAKGSLMRVDRDIITDHSLQVRNTLRIRLRYSYDTKFFTRGAPFSWWLHKVILSREEELYRIATSDQVKSCLARQTARHNLEIEEHKAERRRIEAEKMARRVHAQREIARREDRNYQMQMMQLARETEELRREQEREQRRREQQRRDEQRAQRIRDARMRERRIDEVMMREEEMLVAPRRQRRRMERMDEWTSESSDMSIDSD